MMTKRVSTILCLLFILGFGIGCSANDSVGSIPTSTVVNAPSKINSPTPAQTRLPTQSPAPSSPPMLSTLTSLPTLSLKDAEALFYALLEKNGDCSLPCLWGVTPGITSVEETKSFMLQFSEIDVLSGFGGEVSFYKGDGDLAFEFWNDKWRNSVYFTYIGENQIDFLKLDAEGPKTQDVPTPSPLRKQLVYYSLSQILSNYGRPSEILIYLWPTEVGNPTVDSWNAYDLVLFYPQKGFYVNYILTKEDKGKNYAGCPERINDFSLLTWPLEQQKSLLDIAKQNSMKYGMWENRLDHFMPIEQATTMSLDAFYEKYKKPNERGCIETPKELWPNDQLLTITLTP